MGRKAKFIVAVLLLVVAVVLAGASYSAHQNYQKAEARTMSLDPGHTGPLTDDTLVHVELFGPKRRAADRAERTRNILVGLTVAAGLGGLLFLVLGFTAKAEVTKDVSKEAKEAKEAKKYFIPEMGAYEDEREHVEHEEKWDDAALSFMDKQFINTSGCAFVVVTLCVPFLAFLLGIVGLIMCKHPKARERAITMTIIAALWFGFNLILLFVRFGP